MKLRLTSSFLAFAAGFVLTLAANEATASGWPVFDASNFAQNVLQAARSLEQINNQIQSLQNEAVMLQNMAKDLSRLDGASLSGITGDLQRISGLMTQAQGINFDVQATQTLFDRSFPVKEGQETTIPTIVSE